MENTAIDMQQNIENTGMNNLTNFFKIRNLEKNENNYYYGTSLYDNNDLKEFYDIDIWITDMDQAGYDQLGRLN